MSIRSASAGISTAPRIFGRLIIVTISPAQPGRVSAEAGACGAKRNQPASKSRQRTSTTLGFESGEDWILREEGEEGVFVVGAGKWGGRGFSARMRGSGKADADFHSLPKPGGTIHGTRGHLFGEAGESFRRAGMSVFRIFTPSTRSGGGKTSFGD
jgi:hypothetical protein